MASTPLVSRREFLSTSFAGMTGLCGAFRPVFGQKPTGSDVSRIPKFRITSVRGAELEGINSAFVRVYTDQGLTGTGEMVDTIGAAEIINGHLSQALVRSEERRVGKECR